MGQAFRQRFAGKWARVAPLLVVGVWGVGLAVSFGALAKFSGQSGQQVAGPSGWPVAVNVVRGERKPTIVMCVTAGCPCSRASVGELERVYAKVGERAKVVVVFREAVGTNAEKSDLWELAGNVPGVERVVDHDGIVCGAFKALTSGQVLVFSGGGELVYSGGVTPSRGHSGDSEGGDAVVAVVLGEVPAVRTAPVFGCALP